MSDPAHANERTAALRVPTVHVALVGDHDEAILAHRAIPVALALAGVATAVHVEPRWLHTETLLDARALDGFAGIWAVPGSPYRSMDGALGAIRFARENGVPFLGTCGGFQHAVLEYARHVLRWADAEHAETAPDAPRAVIEPLACALVEAEERLRALPATHLAAACGAADAAPGAASGSPPAAVSFVEAYHCRYGIAPRFVAELTAGPLRAAAEAEDGSVRAVELDGHPFFVATLFQPERAALVGRLPPLVQAFVRAVKVQAAPA